MKDTILVLKNPESSPKIAPNNLFNLHKHHGEAKHDEIKLAITINFMAYRLNVFQGWSSFTLLLWNAIELHSVTISTSKVWSP